MVRKWWWGQLGISAMGGCRCGVRAVEVSGVKGEGFFNRERERG